MLLEGKVALVTGGSQGIGEATASLFAQEGAKVAIADTADAKGETVAARIVSDGGVAQYWNMDVSSRTRVYEVIEDVLSKWEGIDIVVNNAAICTFTPFFKISEEEWDKVFAVNLKGVFFVCQAVGKVMADQGYGRILNVTSPAGKTGGIAAGAPYAASKASVICLTKTLAGLLAQHNVTVNAIAPGIVDTELGRRLPGLEEIISRIPLGRLADPEEIAHSLLFLASENATYITGEILDVNGGLLMD